MNHQITYLLQDIFNLLPDVTNPQFVKSINVNTNDQMLVLYTSSLIRSIIGKRGTCLKKLGSVYTKYSMRFLMTNISLWIQLILKSAVRRAFHSCPMLRIQNKLELMTIILLRRAHIRVKKNSQCPVPDRVLPPINYFALSLSNFTKLLLRTKMN